MDEVKAGIQYVFQTKNELTLALSASGHAAMEAVFSNLVEPGDKVIICCNGIWGRRAMEMAKRIGKKNYANVSWTKLFEPVCSCNSELIRLSN